MLLIGDLHITSRFKDQIISGTQAWIDTYPNEQNIVFLGDYVYHFSYDRNALLALYNFFLTLFEQGKSVYVLAGNHDRLGDSFVFEEAQKAFGILDKYKITNTGKITFITQPLLETIEGQEILFFPYALKNFAKESMNTISTPWLQSLNYLAESSHKNEQKSRDINTCLANYLEQNPDLLVIHHYYFNNTIFPGQKSKFSYKDTALSDQFLSYPRTKFISGHLHQGFSHQNYLCTGSVRSTSSLEINQQKYLFHYDLSSQKLQATPISINPYIEINNQNGTTSTSLFELETKQRSKTDIKNQIANIIVANQSNYTSSSRSIAFDQSKEIPLNTVSLSLKVDQIDYEQISAHLDPELIPQLRDIKLKKTFQTSSSDLLEKLKISSSDLTTFADRKSILKSYIQQKFGNEYPQYEKILQELKVI